MDQEISDKIISATELAESGYRRDGSYMIRRQDDRIYRFREVAKGAFTFDGVQRICHTADDSKIKRRPMSEYL